MPIFGRPSEKKEPEPEEPDAEKLLEDTDLHRKLTLLEQHIAWRATHLLDMKFSIEQVLVLVKKQDIVHDAQALIDAGCSPDTAFDILN